jgi:sphinganine-1-phosphate aldolase
MNDFQQVLNDTVEVMQHPLESFGALDYSEKLLLVSVTFLLIAFYVCFDDLLKAPTRAKNATKYYVFKGIKAIPIVRRKLDAEITKVENDLYTSIHYCDDTNTSYRTLPEEGLSKDKLFELANIYDKMETPAYLEGKVSGAVFSDESNEDEIAIYKEYSSKFAWSNPLWPKLFPGIRKMEAEVVRMTCDLLNGDENSCGTMSTGGSMSILLACLAHRNRAYSKGIKNPEMILPSSAHAAFFKAAEVFNITIIEIPVDKDTYTVSVSKVKSSISSRTALIVASAPNFPFGTMDDIESISKIALKYDVPLHVDACLGGFLLPFVNKERYGIPKYDFSLPGVASMSADTHKYGLTPKGSSVVCYRSKEYLHHQYFVQPDWQGGIYASATLEGSRAGINIALCWAGLLFHGRNDYEEKANSIIDATIKIRDGLAKIPEIRMQGKSNICIVSFTSDKIDIHRFHGMLGERGWQLSNLQFPSGVHIMVTLNHTKPGVVDSLLEDCREVVQLIRETPNEKPEGAAALYGMVQKIPDRSIIKTFAHTYLDTCYSMPKGKQSN